jgi:hypothetical protein
MPGGSNLLSRQRALERTLEQVTQLSEKPPELISLADSGTILTVGSKPFLGSCLLKRVESSNSG